MSVDRLDPDPDLDGVLSDEEAQAKAGSSWWRGEPGTWRRGASDPYRAVLVDERVAVACVAAASRQEPAFAARLFRKYLTTARGPNDALVATEWDDARLLAESLENGRAGAPRIHVATEVPVFEPDPWNSLEPYGDEARFIGSADLSLAVELPSGDSTLRCQLLLEAKVAGKFREKTVRGYKEKLCQPAAYAAGWELHGSNDEASVRIVGTIGGRRAYRSGDSPDHHQQFSRWWHAERANADVAWRVAIAEDVDWEEVGEEMKTYERCGPALSLLEPWLNSRREAYELSG